jgi:predicted Fe-Mo cluster-binding NifX family protein
VCVPISRLPLHLGDGAINKAGIKLGDEPSKKKLIHDGRMSYALNQLAIKVYHLNPKKVDKVFKLVLVKKIWKFSRRIQMTREGGRVGETPWTGLDPSRETRGDRTSRKGRDQWHITPAHQGRGPAKAGKAVDHPAPVQGPKHPADRPPQP